MRITFTFLGLLGREGESTMILWV